LCDHDPRSDLGGKRRGREGEKGVGERKGPGGRHEPETKRETFREEILHRGKKKGRSGERGLRPGGTKVNQKTLV